MDQPKISVIVPVYNLENYIERSVQSICAQTHSDLEIILVDDGSKDQSPQILDQMAQKDNRIKVIHKQNGGVTKARLTGVKHATGSWIGFVDGDDFIESDMYERLLKNALESNSDISHCGYQMVFPNRIDYYYNTGRKLVQNNQSGLNDLLSGEFIEPGLWNKIYKKELLFDFIDSRKMDFSIRNNEDLLMNFYLFKNSRQSIYEDICPYHYTIRRGSAATSSINEHKLRDTRLVFEILLDETRGDDRQQQIIKSRLIAQLIYLSTITSAGQEKLIAPYKKDARRTLRKMMADILRGNFVKGQKIQACWVSIWPWSYHMVHTCYAKLRGTDKKYEV